MNTLKETTQDLLPHTYLVDEKKGKMYAYRRSDGVINVFSKPLSFGKKHRKFEKVVDKDLELAYTSSIS